MRSATTARGSLLRFSPPLPPFSFFPLFFLFLSSSPSASSYRARHDRVTRQPLDARVRGVASRNTATPSRRSSGCQRRRRGRRQPGVDSRHVSRNKIASRPREERIVIEIREPGAHAGGRVSVIGPDWQFSSSLAGTATRDAASN